MSAPPSLPPSFPLANEIAPGLAWQPGLPGLQKVSYLGLPIYKIQL